MSEIHEDVQNETQEIKADAIGQEIVIEDKKGFGYYAKKAVEGVVIFVTGIAVGLLTGKFFGGKDDNEPADAEGPKDE